MEIFSEFYSLIFSIDSGDLGQPKFTELLIGIPFCIDGVHYSFLIFGIKPDWFRIAFGKFLRFGWATDFSSDDVDRSAGMVIDVIISMNNADRQGLLFLRDTVHQVPLIDILLCISYTNILSVKALNSQKHIRRWNYATSFIVGDVVAGRPNFRGKLLLS
jgi:hypothetical protein